MLDNWITFSNTPDDGACQGCGGGGAFTLTRDRQTLRLCTRCTIAGFDRVVYAARLRMEG